LFGEKLHVFWLDDCYNIVLNDFLDTKISKDDYVRIKKITTELFSDPLQKHLSTSRKLEKVPHNKKPNESRGQELWVSFMNFVWIRIIFLCDKKTTIL